MPIILKVIFSGLIAATSHSPSPTPNHALLVDDSQDHRALILLVEGTCDDDSCTTSQLLGKGYQIVADLEDVKIERVKIVDLPPQTTNVRGGRPSLGGIKTPLPFSEGHVFDASWMVSLQRASGGKLLKNCLAEHINQCNLEAIFELPGGQIRSCHLLHPFASQIATNSVLSNFSVCAGGCSHESQAITNAFLVERKIAAESATLAIDERRIKINPARVGGERRITLLILNENRQLMERGNILYRLLQVKAFKALLNSPLEPHTHFGMFKAILIGADAISIPDPTPIFALVPEVGECEAYLAALDSVVDTGTAILDNRYRQLEATELVGSDHLKPLLAQDLKWNDYDWILWELLSMPHSASECDTPTYP